MQSLLAIASLLHRYNTRYEKKFAAREVLLLLLCLSPLGVKTE